MTSDPILSDIERRKAASLLNEITGPLQALPAHLQGGLRNYLVERAPTGGFLRAVLANDLSQAVLRADPVSLADIRAIILFVYNVAPAQSHGSYEAVDAWIAGGAK